MKNKKIIMIVVDDAEKGEIFSNILEEKYEKRFFESFEESVDFIYLNINKISIIILDYFLTNPDRIVLIESAKRKSPDVKIIIITAGQMQDDIFDPLGKKNENCFLVNRSDEERILEIIGKNI